MNRLGHLLLSIGFAAFVGAAVVGPSYFYGPAPKPNDGCIPLTSFTLRLINVPELHNLRPVTDDKRADAIAIFNMLPPPSNNPWDAAYLIDGPDHTGGLIVAKNNRVCGLAVFRGEQWDALRNTLEPKS